MPWIKIDHLTPDKPEIIQMAERLGIDQDAVLGKLIRFWIWADQQSNDLRNISVTAAFLNRITCVTGFAQAMESVGWIEIKKGIATIPNFDRHNGETAKKRAQSADRMQKMRRNGSVTPSVTNREHPRNLEVELDIDKEVNTNTTPTPSGTVAPLPEVLQTVEFESAWKEWQQYRIGIRKKLTAPTIAKQIKMLESLGPAKAIEAIGKSIENGWQGLFDPGDNGGGKQHTRKGISDEVWAAFERGPSV